MKKISIYLIIAIVSLSPVTAISDVPVTYVCWTFYINNSAGQSIEVLIDTLADKIYVESVDISDLGVFSMQNSVEYEVQVCIRSNPPPVGITDSPDVCGYGQISGDFFGCTQIDRSQEFSTITFPILNGDDGIAEPSGSSGESDNTSSSKTSESGGCFISGIAQKN